MVQIREMWCVARFGTICTFLKSVKNTHGGVLILVKLQAEACNFTKGNIPPWVFSRFLNCTNGTKSRNAPQNKKNYLLKQCTVCRCSIKTALKKRPRYRYFPVYIVKFFKTKFFYRISHFNYLGICIWSFI